MAIARAQPATPSRHLFTVDEYYRLAEVGVLTATDRVQLIDGEIIDMPPIGPGHSSSAERVNTLLRSRLGASVQVRGQNPVRLGPRAEPEPDVAVVRYRADFYRSSHPTPADVFLVVEVADSTLAFDRDTKAPMYSRAGIAEYWIVDLVNEQILVHRDPSATGYRSVVALRRGDVVQPLAFPDLSIAVDDILG